jgi:polygalacturonase
MFKQIVITAALVLVIHSCTIREGKSQVTQVRNPSGISEMPAVKEPVFPANTVSITGFGAVGDGQTLNTKAFNDAIEAVTSKGGGKVIIPRGLWLTGPIILKSNVNIFSEDGAIIIFSSDKELYPLIKTNFEGTDTYRCLSPIYGRDLENIAFTGKGIFDGTGQVWRAVKKDKLTESQWNDLVKSGGIKSKDGKTWYPSISYMEGQNLSSMNVPDKMTTLKEFEKIKDFLRPVMVSLVNCKKVLLDGPVFQNSPAWCLHPLLCEDLTIRNITVKNPWYSQNGDGLDLESCRNAIVYDCNFDVGDDAICIKSGKDAEGRRRGRPTENLIIKNCIVYHGHGGVTIGSEMSGGVKNVFVSGCTFIGTDVGLRFKSNRGRGGVVENINCSEINMIDIPAQAISFNLYYGGLSQTEISAEGQNNKKAKDEAPQVSEGTPLFRNISFRNITCKGAAQAIFLQGLPEQNLQNVTLENIDIEAEKGLSLIDVTGVTAKNLHLITKERRAVDIENSRNIDIQNILINGPKESYINIRGEKSKQITIRFPGPEQLLKAIIAPEADSSTIKIR